MPHPYDSPWTCEICKKPIEKNGIIEIINTNPEHGDVGGLPREESDDEASFKPNIKAIVFHKACDPHPESEGYWLGAERADTLADWCAWVHHLSEKTWVSREDLGRLLKFWFSNRGDDIYKYGP